jgi:hypothetical protein
MRKALKIFFLFCLFCFSFGLKAQGDKDKVETLRHEFIKKKLELSVADEEKFWPVYNEYQDKIKAIRKNFRQSLNKAPDNLSDKEAEDLYQLEMKSRQAELDVHKQYADKIKGLIGLKKFVKLRMAEEEFIRIARQSM